jgi:hypothetical protein
MDNPEKQDDEKQNKNTTQYVLEIKEHCDEHHEKFNLYCKEHECPCCRICFVENHGDCKNVTILEKVIKNVKTSTMFTEIEHLIAIWTPYF